MNPYRPDNAEDPYAGEVLRFWFGPPGVYGQRRTCWFEKDPAFDAECRARFLALHERSAGGALAAWNATPADALALIVLTDQLPRNMYRASAQAFATDRIALEAARQLRARAADAGMLPVERLFMYLPFEHSESLEDQRECLELMAPLAAFVETRDAFRYAQRHHEMIARFGRFPHRNAALGRMSTAAEAQFLAQPGSRF